MPLIPKSLRLHRLKTSQDFSFKWEKIPQSVSSLQMSPLHASEGRTQAVKWSRMQGKGCYHVKDRLCICKKGCFIMCPISSSCCHGIGRRWFDRTSARLKYMAWIPGWQCAGSCERSICSTERNISTLQPHYITYTYPQNEKQETDITTVFCWVFDYLVYTHIGLWSERSVFNRKTLNRNYWLKPWRALFIITLYSCWAVGLSTM